VKAATVAIQKPQVKSAAKSEPIVASAAIAGKGATASPLTAKAALHPVVPASLVAAQANSSSAAATAASTIPRVINLVPQDTIELNLNPSGTSGLSYSATGLPNWLTVSTSGELHGTVMAQEDLSYSGTISVSDSSGDSSSQAVTINVLAHHYPGWNKVAGVTVIAPTAVTRTSVNAFGKSVSTTLPLPAQTP